MAGRRLFGTGAELLLRGRGFVLRVLAAEALDASCGIHQLLLAREKRVASRTDFNVQVAFFCRTCLKSLAAGAGYGYLAICWMNLWFHCSLTLTIDS